VEIMKKKALAGLLLISIMVAGCATKFDVEKSYWTGGIGFSHTQLENDIWQIDFTGNAHTNEETRKKYILKKAAQIAIKENFSFFKVLSELDKDLKGVNIARGNASIMGSGRSNQSNIKTNAYTTMTVKFLHNKEGVEGDVYDAKMLANEAIE